jgi:hypothetical protein
VVVVIAGLAGRCGGVLGGHGRVAGGQVVMKVRILATVLFIVTLYGLGFWLQAVFLTIAGPIALVIRWRLEKRGVVR